MKSIRQSPQSGRSGRRTAGRAQRDHILDPYQARQKLHGELSTHFDETGYFVRVDWRAPD